MNEDTDEMEAFLYKATFEIERTTQYYCGQYFVHSIAADVGPTTKADPNFADFRFNYGYTVK